MSMEHLEWHGGNNHLSLTDRHSDIKEGGAE